jgi:hypothetical protein
VVKGDDPVNNSAVRLQNVNRTFLILTHLLAVTDRIGREYAGESALDARWFHGVLPGLDRSDV